MFIIKVIIFKIKSEKINVKLLQYAKWIRGNAVVTLKQLVDK